MTVCVSTLPFLTMAIGKRGSDPGDHRHRPEGLPGRADEPSPLSWWATSCRA